MYMGALLATCFGPKGPFSSNTYIEIAVKIYWVMSVLYKSEISFVNRFLLKGNWSVYRSR
jgi:hypothetical protein